MEPMPSIGVDFFYLFLPFAYPLTFSTLYRNWLKKRFSSVYTILIIISDHKYYPVQAARILKWRYFLLPLRVLTGVSAGTFLASPSKPSIMSHSYFIWTTFALVWSTLAMNEAHRLFQLRYSSTLYIFLFEKHITNADIQAVLDLKVGYSQELCLDQDTYVNVLATGD
jgi:hypothetical protein